MIYDCCGFCPIVTTCPFNIAKSGFLHISTISLFDILGDVEIPLLDNTMDLGIEVSKAFKWSLHIQTKIVTLIGRSIT